MLDNIIFVIVILLSVTIGCSIVGAWLYKETKNSNEDESIALFFPAISLAASMLFMFWGLDIILLLLLIHMPNLSFVDGFILFSFGVIGLLTFFFGRRIYLRK
jgi:hypothetical protein